MRPVPDDPRLHIQTELAKVLAGLPVMQQLDSRQQLMRVLRQHLDHQVMIRDFPEPWHQCVEIVHCCLPFPDAWARVVAAVESLAPHARELARLQSLSEEWERLHRLHERELHRHEQEVQGVLPEQDWHELRAELSRVQTPMLGRLYQQATGHLLATLPAWCATAWDVFVYAAGHYAPPDRLPQEMLFLLLLEREVDSATATVLRRRNQRQASVLGLTEELDRQRVVLDSGGGQPGDPVVYLVVQVEPELGPELGPDALYTVTHYRQWYGEDCWHSQQRGHRRMVPSGQLEEALERVVAQMEVEWRDRTGEVVVELVLPLELLNEDVAWWRAEPSAAYLEERLLAMSYPVVVRSLDRLREVRWHSAWHRRWRLLWAEPAHGRAYRSRPGGANYFTTMEAELNSDPQWSSLVLSEPPTPDGPTGRREIMTGLRAGVPVIVWHRTQRTTDEFWEEIREMIADGGIARLPVHARRLRLAALQADPDQQKHHIGRHLVVLWDDPDRLPELTDSGSEIGGMSSGR